MSSRTSPVQLLVAPAEATVLVARTCVRVRDLTVMADIGINPDEFGRRQPLVIQAEIEVREVAADRIESTFDYREVVRRAEALAGERIALIETFARRLAEACLQDPAVTQAEIVVDKPAALSNGLAGVRVVLGPSDLGLPGVIT